VVVAAGAWNASLGEAAGADIPLVPFRRHLVELRTRADVAASEPVVWRLEDEVYYRKQGAGVLASPCDEARSTLAVEAPAQNASDPRATQALNEKLTRTAPGLDPGSIVRAWACFRTFAADRELVVGSDPRVQGLHWFGGLGGRGMSVALAAAEILCARLLGESLPPRAAAVSPSRFFTK
jgi:D-arginine dehydrogenase